MGVLTGRAGGRGESDAQGVVEGIFEREEELDGAEGHEVGEAWGCRQGARGRWGGERRKDHSGDVA